VTITLSIRLDLPNGTRLGPGKLALLGAIAREGSIAAAARVLSMSYPRAFKLVEELNQQFRGPLIEKHLGGREGGGASLTKLGDEVLAMVSALQAAASQGTETDRSRLLDLL